VKGIPRRAGAVLALASLVLVTAACGREDSGDGDGTAVPGVTSEPCPEAVDQEKGCIYLGVISDLTGAFKGVGIPFTEGQKAFWADVNKNGGIGDYEVDVTKYTKDNAYSPDTHAQVFGEIKDEVLALAQSLGSAQTAGILEDAKTENILVAPASLSSGWLFEDIVPEFGSSYCAEAMNAVDYAVDELGATSVAAVHYPGDYGDDAAVGVRVAAEARGITFTDVPTGPGGAEEQTAAIGAVLKAKPDLVFVSTGPIELATIMGGAAAQGFRGAFIGSVPTWNVALLDNPDLVPLMQAMYRQATPVGGWDYDSAGHDAMRAAAGAMDPNDWFTVGWSSGYGLKGILEKAMDDGKLTRAGMVETVAAMTSIDSQGMFPEGSGNFAAEPDDAAVRATIINKVDPSASSGVVVEKDFFTGPTAEAYEFAGPCYLDY